ncbi:MAG: OmpA family protein [Bacteroidia bacterium]|nr:OmpA family protein [Bacteroidia bacterium]
MMRTIFFFLLLGLEYAWAQAVVTPNDGNWSLQQVVLRNTPEADLMIRTGDIDNLGFGFGENVNPFCERSTEPHYYPWDPAPENAPGTDRIMIPSSFEYALLPCSHDGYSEEPRDQKQVQVITLPLTAARGMTVTRVVLQMMLDDFQSPVLCSRFQMTLNGRRFAEGEKLINSLNQTGPTGKVVSFVLPEDMLDLFQADQLTIRIDDPTTHAGDGFAIDFVKLLINHKGFPCTGNLPGVVRDRNQDLPVAGATVEIRGYGQVRTGADGRFLLTGLPAGMHPVTAFAPGYNSGSAMGDVWQSGEEEVVIYLDPADKSVVFGNKTLREGESVAIYNIQFDLGSAEIRTDARAELDKIYTFLQANPSAEIELSGHTSSDGDDAANKKLSLRRVLSCKGYLVQKGIDEGRILTMGYGEERPLAGNDTEAGRVKNRRVEMRVLKL